MSTTTPTPKPKTGPVTRSQAAKPSGSGARKRPRKAHDDLEHPYIAKVDHKIGLLQDILEKIFTLADNDLIVVNRDTGLNDFTFNEQFAKKLEDVGKFFIRLQKQCDDKANCIRERIQEFKDKKLDKEDMVIMADSVKGERRDPSKNEEYTIIERRQYAAWVSSGSEDDEPEKGDMDTKFKYRKTNNNGETSFFCTGCEQSFRNKIELRNHYSTHHKELYRCMKCSVICRSVRSFLNHTDTHKGVVYKCKVCGDSFVIKTSLKNHMQKHSKERYTCETCGKQFQYKSTYSEHTEYRHTDTKTVPCPVCKKFFWTPSAMRSHRAKRHGLVTQMYRGVI